MAETNSSRLPCPVPCLSSMCPRHNPYTRTPAHKEMMSTLMKEKTYVRTPEHREMMSERLKKTTKNRKRVNGRFVKEEDDGD